MNAQSGFTVKLFKASKGGRPLGLDRESNESRRPTFKKHGTPEESKHEVVIIATNHMPPKPDHCEHRAHGDPTGSLVSKVNMKGASQSVGKAKLEEAAGSAKKKSPQVGNTHDQKVLDYKRDASQARRDH